ncbi:creatininase family protein [Paenibacillus sp. FA6]|uniref:creatininase family protein n=1 Tax=Paenibacillus sp. FA6 TaxID=3413029 RepID=UPI003F6585CE
MSTNYQFQNHNREALTRLAQEGSYVIVPLAATEQHGPHLPVYTDTMICEYVVQKSIERVLNVMPLLMTPILSIGCSDHHLNYGGTISFSSTTYQLMLNDVTNSLVKDGFTKIIFINGHGGNAQIMTQVAQDTAVRHDVWTSSASYWQIAKEELDRLQAKEVGLVPGHAGGFETSLIMALHPELVNHDAIHPDHPVHSWLDSGNTYIGKHGQITGNNGYTDSADQASAEKGQMYLDAIVDKVSEWLLALHETISTADRRDS